MNKRPHIRKRTGDLAWERAQTSGATYRQFDHWVRKGYIKAEQRHMSADHAGQLGSGSGVWRFISDRELDVLDLMVPLVKIGLTPSAAASQARRIIDGQRVREGVVELVVLP